MTASHIEARASQSLWQLHCPLGIKMWIFRHSYAYIETAYLERRQQERVSYQQYHQPLMQGIPASLQSPGPRCKEDKPACRCMAADAEKTGRLAVAQLLMQRRPASSQSPSPKRKEDQLAHCQPTANARMTSTPACCS
jgi:hypothetical protein